MLDSTNPTCPYCPYVQKSYESSGPMRKREKRLALRAHIETTHPKGWEKLQKAIRERYLNGATKDSRGSARIYWEA